MIFLELILPILFGVTVIVCLLPARELVILGLLSPHKSLLTYWTDFFQQLKPTNKVNWDFFYGRLFLFLWHQLPFLIESVTKRNIFSRRCEKLLTIFSAICSKSNPSPSRR